MNYNYKDVLLIMIASVIVFYLLTYVYDSNKSKDSYTDVKIIRVTVKSDSLDSADLESISVIFNHADVVVIYRESLDKTVKIID